MARNIFLTEKFSYTTRVRGLTYAVVAMGLGLDYAQTCQIVMYYLERCRQGSYCGRFSNFVEQKAKSGHRYRKGRNGESYRESGDRLLGQCASLVGLDDECNDGAMILDRAIERNYNEDLNGVRNPELWI